MTSPVPPSDPKGTPPVPPRAPFNAAANPRQGEKTAAALSAQVIAAIGAGDGEGCLALLKDIRDARLRVEVGDFWAAAGASGSGAMLQVLWRDSDNVRRPWVQQALQAAARAGHLNVFDWMDKNIGGMTDAEELAVCCGMAVKHGHEKTAWALLQRLRAKALVPERKADYMRNIMLACLAAGRGEGMVDDILAQEGGRAGLPADFYFKAMMRAVAAGYTPNFRVLTADPAHAALLDGPQRDQLLMAAVDKGFDAALPALLQMGSDVNAFDGGILRHAAAAQDRSAARARLEALVAAGADGAAALALARAQWTQETDQETDEVAALEKRIREIAARNVALCTNGGWTRRIGAESALHHAARHRVLAGMLAAQRGAARPDVAQWLEENARGETVLCLVERTGSVAQVFAPALWARDAALARRLVGHLSEKARGEFDMEGFERALRQIDLKGRGDAARFKLGGKAGRP